MTVIQILPFFVFAFVGEAAHNLTFMFITSFGQFGFNASGAVPAANIALEDINNNPSILNGYHLTYDQVKHIQDIFSQHFQHAKLLHRPCAQL